jgi:hypothetical protein
MKKTTEKKYETLELQKKGKLIITEDVKKKIDQMHNRIGSVEWCGFIFYEKVEGSISNPETYVAKTTDIYMMDIGSHSYTESDNHTEDVINMVDRVPAYMENRYGLIHTHHNMSAFFSGTDDQELHDNVHLYSYYLSLIVNFDGKWCAKIAKLIDVNSSSYTITEEDEKDVHVQIPAKKVMTTFDLDIEFETSIYNEIIEERIGEIKERKKKEEEEKKQFSFYPTSYMNNLYGDQKYTYGSVNMRYVLNDKTTPSKYLNNYKLNDDDEIEWFISSLVYLDVDANEPLHNTLADLSVHESDPMFSLYVDQLNDNAMGYAIDHFTTHGAYAGVCKTLEKLESYSGVGVEKLKDALETVKEQLNINNEYSL